MNPGASMTCPESHGYGCTPADHEPARPLLVVLAEYMADRTSAAIRGESS